MLGETLSQINPNLPPSLASVANENYAPTIRVTRPRENSNANRSNTMDSSTCFRTNWQLQRSGSGAGGQHGRGTVSNLLSTFEDSAAAGGSDTTSGTAAQDRFRRQRSRSPGGTPSTNNGQALTSPAGGAAALATPASSNGVSITLLLFFFIVLSFLFTFFFL